MFEFMSNDRHVCEDVSHKNSAKIFFKNCCFPTKKEISLTKHFSGNN